MNRRSFLALVMAAPVAAVAVLQEKPSEPICAWCNGTGVREYRYNGYSGYGRCDACQTWTIPVHDPLPSTVYDRETGIAIHFVRAWRR